MLNGSPSFLFELEIHASVDSRSMIDPGRKVKLGFGFVSKHTLGRIIIVIVPCSLYCRSPIAW